MTGQFQRLWRIARFFAQVPVHDLLADFCRLANGPAALAFFFEHRSDLFADLFVFRPRRLLALPSAVGRAFATTTPQGHVRAFSLQILAADFTLRARGLTIGRLFEHKFRDRVRPAVVPKKKKSKDAASARPTTSRKPVRTCETTDPVWIFVVAQRLRNLAFFSQTARTRKKVYS